MEHSTSEGGTTTIEGLYIQEGYWRATKTSTNVYKCFNTKACAGGLTDTPTFCRVGYEGPCECVLNIMFFFLAYIKWVSYVRPATIALATMSYFAAMV